MRVTQVVRARRGMRISVAAVDSGLVAANRFPQKNLKLCSEKLTASFVRT